MDVSSSNLFILVGEHEANDSGEERIFSLTAGTFSSFRFLSGLPELLLASDEYPLSLEDDTALLDEDETGLLYRLLATDGGAGFLKSDQGLSRSFSGSIFLADEFCWLDKWGVSEFLAELAKRSFLCLSGFLNWDSSGMAFKTTTGDMWFLCFGTWTKLLLAGVSSYFGFAWAGGALGRIGVPTAEAAVFSAGLRTLGDLWGTTKLMSLCDELMDDDKLTSLVGLFT
jgi:hypothetical protein